MRLSQQVVLCVFAPFAVVGAGLAQSRPNIILVMTDDQGWGDTDYNGHPTLLTPELDTMAAAGMVFNRMYAAAPVCSPTRASVLTGRHPRRIGIDSANVGRMKNPELTLTEIAQTQGYRTGHFGKWHLGTLTRTVKDSNRGGRTGNEGVYSPPWQHGYDVTYATEAKVPTHDPMDNPSGSQDNGSYGTRYWTGPGQSVPTNAPELDGDDSRVIVDQLLDFVDDSRDQNEPFLAVTWFHTPHKPVIKDPDHAAAYAGLSDSKQRYYSALTAMDAQMGRLREHLRDLGIEEDTVVMFTSDNGPENLGSGSEGVTGGLRDRKRSLHEGGVRVPGIIEWPGHITPGQTDVPAVTSDYLPTLLDLWGLEMPDDRPLDGESLAPVLLDAATARNDSIKFFYQSQRSIIDGRYKLISTNSGGTYKLYDLLADPGETTDITGGNGETAARLLAELNAWIASADASRTGSDYETGIAAVAGALLAADDPLDLDLGSRQGNTPELFVERQYVTLGADLAVDSDGSPASYDSGNLPPGATVLAGTVVHSYLLHFDPTETIEMTDLTIAFDQPILGVIGKDVRLDGSDFLAFGDPLFNASGQRRMLLGESSFDGWAISADGRTIFIDTRAGLGGLDELRILTQSPLQFQVPEPGSAVLVSLLGVIGLARRRQIRRSSLR